MVSVQFTCASSLSEKELPETSALGACSSPKTKKHQAAKGSMA